MSKSRTMASAGRCGQISFGLMTWPQAFARGQVNFYLSAATPSVVPATQLTYIVMSLDTTAVDEFVPDSATSM